MAIPSLPASSMFDLAAAKLPVIEALNASLSTVKNEHQARIIQSKLKLQEVIMEIMFGNFTNSVTNAFKFIQSLDAWRQR